MSMACPQPQFLQLGGYTLQIYRADAALPIVYLHTGKEASDEVAALCSGCCTLVCIDGTDWNRDFSPWPAPRAFKKGEDFSGGADAYLQILRRELIPAAEDAIGGSGCLRVLSGYSLAGLFALYAMYRCLDFSGAASISGSLWYNGFAEYACVNRPAPGVYYLSVGDREHLGKNPRMAAVKACTDQIAGCLAQAGPVCREENPGGHFHDPQGRTARGIRAVCRMLAVSRETGPAKTV